MRRIARTLVVVCTAVLVSAVARAQGGHGGGLPVSETFTFPKGERRVAIPFTLAGEHIVIPVSVNGAPVLQMVLDTGMPSPGVLLYRGTAADSVPLSFTPAAIRVGGAGGGGAIEARLATDVRLGLGSLAIQGSIAIVMPPKPEMSALHDGIIGATLFRNLVVTIDHDQRELVLEQPAGFVPPRDAIEVPLEWAGRVPYVKADLLQSNGERATLRLVLDIGAQHAVSLNLHANKAITLPSNALATRVGRGMSGVMTGHVGRIAGLELGGQRLENVVAMFPDSAFENPRGLDSRDGNLGSGVLGRFHVTFDAAHQRMFLRPNPRFAEPFEFDMSGVHFDPDSTGVLRVSEVLPGSPAAEAGITPADVLVAVDGTAADPRMLMRERARFRVPGRVVALRLRGKSGEREVKLTLRRLI